MIAVHLAWLIGIESQSTKPNPIEVTLLSTLDQHFWDAKMGRWREMVGSDDQVFLWGYSVLLSTFAIGARVDPATYKPRMEKAFDGLAKYWTTKAPGAYAVSPGQNPKNPDRYYDDNAWVGLAAMEAFDVTKERKYLEIAKKVITYLRSGEDDKIGGGIYWHEDKKESKNACVNAPAAMLAFRLCLVTKQKQYALDGVRWQDWTQKLVDQKDWLVMDNMNLAGKIEPTKWSYNTACYYQAMLLRMRTLRVLHPMMEIDESLVQLIRQETLASAKARWINPKTKLVKNPGMFAMHLMEAIAPENPKDVVRTVGAVFEKCRNEDGLLGEYWDRKPLPKEQLKLMYTASLLRTVLLCRSR
jgi:Glycosyl hydrolase family 76